MGNQSYRSTVQKVLFVVAYVRYRKELLVVFELWFRKLKTLLIPTNDCTAELLTSPRNLEWLGGPTQSVVRVPNTLCGFFQFQTSPPTKSKIDLTEPHGATHSLRFELRFTLYYKSKRYVRTYHNGRQAFPFTKAPIPFFKTCVQFSSFPQACKTTNIPYARGFVSLDLRCPIVAILKEECFIAQSVVKSSVRKFYYIQLLKPK